MRSLSGRTSRGYRTSGALTHASIAEETKVLLQIEAVTYTSLSDAIIGFEAMVGVLLRPRTELEAAVLGPESS
jgi:hypothetical protein